LYIPPPTLQITYSPNSPIPLWVILESDRQATDLLVASKTFRVRLRRSVAIGSDAVDDKREERTDTTFEEVCAEGLFWPASVANHPSGDVNDEVQTKSLEGEVYIPNATKPSFIFPGVSVRYFIDFYLSETAGLQLTGHTLGMRLASQKVDIVLDMISKRETLRSRALPGYSRPSDVQYDTSIGVLTAANQRFLHHGHGFM